MPKLNTRNVAYSSTFLRFNVCEKFTSFCQVLKKDAHEWKSVAFFCLTVYVCMYVCMYVCIVKTHLFPDAYFISFFCNCYLQCMIRFLVFFSFCFFEHLRLSFVVLLIKRYHVCVDRSFAVSVPVVYLWHCDQVTSRRRLSEDSWRRFCLTFLIISYVFSYRDIDSYVTILPSLPT